MSDIQVLIKLNESGDAQSFQEENLIHIVEYERVKGIIAQKIAFVNDIEKNRKQVVSKDCKSHEEPKRLHDTITILGSRGSGKTSFLKSIMYFYRCHDEVAVLDIIDPTLMEEKGHVFLNIISIIQEAVEKVLNQKDCDPCNKEHKNDRKEWRDKVAKLAAGIPSIDGIGGHYNDNNWQDPEYVMDKGLKGVSASRKLEQEFNCIIELALKHLEKKLFLLTFDDIDIDFKKGWPVLETIRKYCTSPKLVILLSGDMHLYSMAIRKQQWKNFGRPLLMNEAEQQDKLSYYNEMVTEMEGQYMQKVMKPTNRIHLKTLNEKLLKPEFVIRVWEGENKANTHIKDVYIKALQMFGIKNKNQAEAYYSFLLSLPVRSQIQFLLPFYSKDGSWGGSQINIESDILINAFLSELYDKQVDVQLATSVPKFLNIITLKLLLNEKVLSDAYQLQPTTTDKSLNSSLVALNFLISSRIRNNPSLIFDYFIRIGLTRNFLSSLGYQGENDNENESGLSRSKKLNTSNVVSSKPSIEGLCKHASLLQDKVLKDSVGLMIAYMQANYYVFGRSTQIREEQCKVGMIPLLSLAGKRKQALGSMSNRIDAAFKEKSPIQKAFGFFPLSISSHPWVNRSSAVYSIYNLIGVIAELLRQKETGITDITLAIKQLSQVRLYSMPDFKRGNINLDLIEIDDSDFENNSEIIDEYSLLIDLFQDWRTLHKGFNFSPQTIGKTFTRLFTALENVSINVENDNVADILQLQIISLFNSVLIEEAIENFDTNKNKKLEIKVAKEKKGVNINNIRKDVSIFKNNLIAVLDRDDMVFTRWILSCPLLLAYINPNSDFINELKIFILNGQKSSSENVINVDSLVSESLVISVFNILSDVRIRENVETLDVSFSDRLTSNDRIILNLSNEELFNKLSKSKAQFELFEDEGSKNRSSNKIIKEKYSDIFGIGENASKRIKNFRKYLKDNNIRW